LKQIGVVGGLAMSEEWEEAICPNCGAEGVSRQEGIMRCSACFSDLPFDEDNGFGIGSDFNWDEEDEDEEEVDDDDYELDEDFLEEE
jgi:hypothetical protein